MSTHNIGFHEEKSKIISELSSNIHLISSSANLHLYRLHILKPDYLMCFQLACKYITDIVTIYNPEIPGQVKFDLRFVVMLASVKPLKLYVHEKFYCRCSVK